MHRTLLLTLGLALTAAPALAGGFEAKTMRAPFSAREVERGLVLGKGWVEIDLTNEYKNATGYWSSEGEAVEFDDASWLYTTQSINARYGITRRAELFWRFETHYAQLTNESLGTDTSQFGVGDPEFGYTYEVFRSLAPLTSAVVYGTYKAPLGNESPGNYVGGPNTFSAFVTTTGTPDITLGLAGKKQLGPAAVVLDLGYVYRTSGTPLYALETEFNQFQARIKPGNIARVKGALQLQAINQVALQVEGVLQNREATRIGNTSGGLLPSRDLDPIEGSEGVTVDVNPELILNISRGIDLRGGASIPVVGEDFEFFPIEDLHPTRGVTYTGTFSFRY